MPPDVAQGIHSRAAHAGERHMTRRHAAPPRYTPTVNALEPSVTYLYPQMSELDAAMGGEPDVFAYHRYGNPTLKAFGDALAALCTDQAHLALTTVAASTGMAAVHVALLAALREARGRGVAAARDCYGASHALVKELFPALGVPGHIVDATDIEATRAQLAQARPAALLVESISNPMLRVPDLARLAVICTSLDVALLVDNTFPTPIACKPLDLGAAMEIHSATKYIGGHGDAMGGLVVAHERYGAALRESLKTTGGALGSFEAWLLHRGLKTLPLRYLRQTETAKRLAQWLQDHPRVTRVVYPGLASHPDRALAQTQFNGCFGAVIAFDVAQADAAAVFRFMEALRLIQPGTSLGDLYSLMLYPAHASHRALSPEQRHALGIGDGLVRLSVGIEDFADLSADLDQALRAVFA